MNKCKVLTVPHTQYNSWLQCTLTLQCEHISYYEGDTLIQCCDSPNTTKSKTLVHKYLTVSYKWGSMLYQDDRFQPDRIKPTMPAFNYRVGMLHPQCQYSPLTSLPYLWLKLYTRPVLKLTVRRFT